VGALPSTEESGAGGASATPSASSDARQSPSPSRSAEAIPSIPWSPPPVPTVPGDQVYSVSEAISARDAGTLGSRTIDVGGYWSASGLVHSCPAPDHTLNKLEIWCDNSAYGITERFEMAMTTISNGMETSFVPAAGPLLQPYAPDDVASRLFAETPNGPTPIVVAGHFSDPGAAGCLAAVRDACRERFVLESILAYDPASAPTLPPSPIPTPFPSPAPPGLFEATQCSGDVAYSFIGWTTAEELNVPMAFDGHAWAAVTAGIVPLGEWSADPNVPGLHFSLAMGRRVCLSFDMMGGGIAFSVVKGTAYRVWDDGRRTTSDDFGPGAGDPSLPPAGTAPPLPNGIAVAMRGSGLADLAATIRDWSGDLRAARPATNDELALPGAATGNEHNAAALVLPNDPRSVLIVMAECGSDRSVTVTVTKDRTSVLLLAASRTDCRQPGARRGAVLTFRSAVPSDITAFAGL